MRVAIPLFGSYVAPRFGHAMCFLISEILDGTARQHKIIKLEPTSWSRRLDQLKQLDVDTVLCGGFNRKFIPLAESLGIRILSGLIGEAQTVLQAFTNGDELPICPCPQSRAQSFRGRHERRRVRCRMTMRNGKLKENKITAPIGERRQKNARIRSNRPKG